MSKNDDIESKIRYMQHVAEDADTDQMDEVIRNMVSDEEDWDASCIFPDLVETYTKENEDVRKGIDKACEAIFGYDLYQIACQIREYNEE